MDIREGMVKEIEDTLRVCGQNPITAPPPNLLGPPPTGQVQPPSGLSAPTPQVLGQPPSGQVRPPSGLSAPTPQLIGPPPSAQIQPQFQQPQFAQAQGQAQGYSQNC